MQVLTDDGRWYLGELRAYRRVDGVWSGFVHWTAGVGMTYVGWFSQDRLRGDATAPPRSHGPWRLATRPSDGAADR